MVEISAAELKKLRALEGRLATSAENLTEVRARRDQYRAEAVEARRGLREADKRASDLSDRLDLLVAENARMADELASARSDLEAVGSEGAKLRTVNERLTAELAAAGDALADLRKQGARLQRERDGLAKQVSVLSDKVDGREPPELTSEQLSELLSGFVDTVGAQTGLHVSGTRLDLKVGFSGRGGGTFVVPAFGVDPDTLPQLHDVRLELTRDGLSGPDEV